MPFRQVNSRSAWLFNFIWICLAILENRFFPGPVSAGKLASIRPSEITKFKHLVTSFGATSFRDLAYNPGNLVRRPGPPAWLIWLAPFSLLAFLSFLAACSGRPTLPAELPRLPLAEELVVYGRAGHMPQSVLDAFQAAHRVKVIYRTYATPEQAVEELRAGGVYGALILGSSFIPQLVEAGLLAEIDYQNVPNFRNLPLNFRDLSYDPGNRYSVVIRWGTTGLLVRRDLAQRPADRWLDLWEPGFYGKIGVRPYRRDLIGMALKTLGYSINTEDPGQLEAALRRLLELRPNIFFLDPSRPDAADTIAAGEVGMIYGWPYDALAAQKINDQVAYVIPREGTLLWSDNLIIPANSPHPQTAEAFLNFLLRPEISALVVNELNIAVPNDAAYLFIHPDILNNPLVFAPNKVLEKAEMILPVSPETEALHAGIWERFLAAEE